MPLQVLASQAQSPKPDYSDHNAKRGSANYYAPSVWGDHFLSYASVEVDITLEQRVQELKEEVKTMLMAPVNKPSQQLNMIDHIQRLGMSYYFENEINEILKQIHENCFSTNYLQTDDDDLYTTALRFRLLRQQGYHVSCDMFNKFKQINKGTFKESLLSDVVGLLSLYEATHLRVHGEDVLEEALIFTRTHLESAAHHGHLSSPLSKQVTHALYQPLWKGCQRIEARHYLSIYEENDSHNQTLLTLAKHDFNLVQKVHQRELSDITRWWKDLDFANKLPFARDRIVEAYFWAFATLYEPEYYFARKILCVYSILTTVLDDIYDVYGTYEELELFTQAIESWDISAVDQLPQLCLKVCYKALLDAYSGYEEKLANEGNLYRIHYAREAIKIQLRGYFQEARWLKEKYTPTMDEYIPNELNSSFFPMAITSFVGMGVLVTEDLMEWVSNDPKIVKATSLIGRLMNDMAGHKFEQSKEQGASSVECYMKQYGVTEEEAKLELTKQKDAAWKDINQEWLHLHSSTTIPKPLLLMILNLARSSEVLFKNEEIYTNPQTMLKDFAVSLFVEPVPV